MDFKGVLALATLTEAIVEYFVAPKLAKIDKEYVKYVSMGVGILLCLAYRVDVLNMMVGMTPIHPAVGWVLSGVIIGRGGNFVNDIISFFKGGA